MNSTENATFSVLPDSTSPKPVDIIYTVLITLVVVIIVMMVIMVFTFHWSSKRSYMTYGPESVSLNDYHIGEENTHALVRRTSPRSVLLSCSTTHDVQTDTTDSGNIVVTEDLFPANYVQNEPQFSESSLGPYGKDSEHKVVMPLLPKVTTVPDKSERCYNNDTNEPVLAANDVHFIDEERTEQCLSECEISSTNIGSDNHIADNQEKLIFDIAECKISTVTHLKSPVGNDEQNTDETLPKTLVKPEEQNVETNLDWNRVFRFLVNHLDARKWMLFFNTLYGNTYNLGSLNVDAKLKQVEHDTKQRVGGDTVTLLMEQFKAWKEFSGRNAKVLVIYQTLKEDGMNDTLENFETYMRNPPVLPAYKHLEPYITGRQSPLSENSLSLSLPSLNASSLSLPGHAHGEILSGHASFPSLSGKYTCKRVCEVSYEVQNNLQSEKGISDERGEPAGASSQMINSLNQTNSETIVEEKQIPSNSAEQCIETKEITVCGTSLQKKANLSSSDDKTRRKRHCHSKRKRKKTLKFSKRSVYMLIESFLQNTKAVLRKDMYTLFLQKTLSDIIKEAKVSEDDVLSLTCTNYHDADELKTKKETIYVIYSEDRRLTLGVSAFQELQLYTDKARQQVIDRVGLHINREDQHYLFIDYDGKRIQSQKSDGDLDDEANSDDSSLKRVLSLSDSSDDDSMEVSW